MQEFRKLVWISDPHLTETGEVEGVPCRARLSQAIDQIKRHHADAICCIAIGDLTDTGEAAEYAAVAGLINDLPMPVLPLIGNHDNRDVFRAMFPPPGDAMEDYQQFRWDRGDLTLLCLDTHSPGEDCGRMNDARYAWLKEQLRTCGGRRVLVFMHHPPGHLWLGLQDDIMLKDEARLIDILTATPEVEYLFCGHVHRPVSGVIGGMPFTTLRSLAHQTRPGHELTDWNDFVARDERPQYGVIFIASDRVIIHANDLEVPT